MVRRYPKRVEGFRSKLERDLAASLDAAGVPFEYEGDRIAYVDPDPHHYVPDFTLKSGVIVEGKGEFTPEDRRKHLLIKRQRPDLDIRFVFSRSKTPLYKGSKTTYAQWCERNGFRYADKVIPPDWLT
jgi:hypothetical protein